MFEFRVKKIRPPRMAIFLNKGPKVAVWPTCMINVIGIKTAIKVIAEILVLKAVNNDIPAISIVKPESTTAISAVPNILAIKPKLATSILLTVCSSLKKWLVLDTIKIKLSIIRSITTDVKLTSRFLSWFIIFIYNWLLNTVVKLSSFIRNNQLRIDLDVLI